MKRRLHWRRRTAIFRPLDQSDRLKLAAVHLVRAAALLLQEKKREEEAGRSDGEVWLTINDAMPSLDLCCDYIADLLNTKEARQ